MSAAAVKVPPPPVDVLTVTRGPNGHPAAAPVPPLALALVALVALAVGLALAGCSGQDADASATRPGPATTSAPSPDGPAADRLPAPCSLVDASDVSLFVALSSWEETSGEQDGRAVCRFATDGFTITTVTMWLAVPARPPAGLCAPRGSTPTLPAADLLCGYTGPGADTVTAVAAGSGLAVGVRVVGPDAGRHATLLAQHALTHL